MKTTIDLPDHLVRRVKQLAQSEGATMRELMIEGLTHEIERRSKPAERVDLIFRTSGGSGLHADIDPSKLTDYAYDLPR